MTRLFPLLTASLIALGASQAPAHAQANPFAPVLIINDRAITNYELQQRALFLKLLGAGGDLEKLALDGLIEDRLRLQEAKRFKIDLPEKDITAAMEEFAGRANLTAEAFVAQLGKAGVAPETFRDFVSAGAIWREIARGKFSATTKVSEIEIDRAIEAETRKTELSFSLSELIIAVPPGREADAMALAQEISASVKTEAEFSAAVAKYSAAASRDQNGRLPPMIASNMPSQLTSIVTALKPGQLSAPVPMSGAIAILQLRGVTEIKSASAGKIEVEYGRLRQPATPEGEAELARVRSQIDTCKDVYGVTAGLGAEKFSIQTAAMASLPADLALELGRLDPGESALRSTAGARELLILCARRPVSETPIDRETVRRALLNRKIEAQSNLYLSTLRADAIIRKP